MNEVTAQMYHETFSTPVGAAVLEDILVQGFVYLRLRRGTVIDPHSSVFCDGARSLALLIKEKVMEGRTKSTSPASLATNQWLTPRTIPRTGGDNGA